MPNAAVAEDLQKIEEAEQGPKGPELRVVPELKVLDEKGIEGAREMGDEVAATAEKELQQENGWVDSAEKQAHPDLAAQVETSSAKAKVAIAAEKKKYEMAISPFAAAPSAEEPRRAETVAPATKPPEAAKAEQAPAVVSAPEGASAVAEPFVAVDKAAEDAAFRASFQTEKPPAEPYAKVDVAKERAAEDAAMKERREREEAIAEFTERMKALDETIATAKGLEAQYGDRPDLAGQLYTTLQMRTYEAAQADKDFAEKQIAFMEAKNRGADQARIEAAQAEIGVLAKTFAAKEQARLQSEQVYAKALAAMEAAAAMNAEAQTTKEAEPTTIEIAPEKEEGPSFVIEARNPTKTLPQNEVQRAPRSKPKSDKVRARDVIAAGAMLTGFAGKKLFGLSLDFVDTMLTRAAQLVWNPKKLGEDIKKNFHEGWTKRGAIMGTFSGFGKTFFGAPAETAKERQSSEEIAKERQATRERRDITGF